jgi:hypothetical protein
MSHIAEVLKSYWKLCDTTKSLGLKYGDCRDFMPYLVHFKFSADIQMDSDNNKFSSNMSDSKYPIVTYNTVGLRFPQLDVIEKNWKASVLDYMVDDILIKQQHLKGILGTRKRHIFDKEVRIFEDTKTVIRYDIVVHPDIKGFLSDLQYDPDKQEGES